MLAKDPSHFGRLGADCMHHANACKSSGPRAVAGVQVLGAFAVPDLCAAVESFDLEGFPRAAAGRPRHLALRIAPFFGLPVEAVFSLEPFGQLGADALMHRPTLDDEGR